MPETNKSTITSFMENNFYHFNAGETLRAAKGYRDFLSKNSGNKMMVTLAGAMSTGRLGVSLAEMITQDKVHVISCTGANLEESVFRLVAGNKYSPITNYRDLSVYDETLLLSNGLNRVTDVGVPEEETISYVSTHLTEIWKELDRDNKTMFPYEVMYELLRRNVLPHNEDPSECWVLEACKKNIPIIVPGHADSSTGNALAALYYTKQIKNPNVVKSDVEQMSFLLEWYLNNTKDNDEVGFFQIGGGIAGDFPICAVPLLRQELNIPCKLWGYFCQIGDSPASYGGYSGALPREKITWSKLSTTTPMFAIESDATIVAPLIFNYVLGN